MELSILLNYLLKKRGTAEHRSVRECAALCANAGFRYVDYTPDFLREDYLDAAKRDLDTLSQSGITVEQAHAPFNRYRAYKTEDFGRFFMRSFEAANAVGAKYMVVHADEYRTKDCYDAAQAENEAYEFLAPFVEYAEKNGMIVAIENVFEDTAWPMFDGKSRFTSRVDELIGIIERFHSANVKCCWDFGHAKCAFGTEHMLDALKQASKYVCCTHVHDNYYGKDLHLLPFLGDIEWESHMKYLGEIAYAGKFSFEFVYGRIPDELLPMMLNTAHSVGEYLLGLSKK